MRASKICEILQSIPLFGVLDENGIKALVLKSIQSEYPIGSEIDTVGAITVVLSGAVAVTKHTGDKKLLMRMLVSGSVTGVATLYSEESEGVSSLTATKNTVALSIPQAVISELIHENGAFAEGYIAFLTSRIRFLNRRIKADTSGAAETKLALHIAMSDEAHTGQVDLGVSYTDLADMLDIGRASLYRALDDLTARGIISRNGRKIFIEDERALIEIAESSQN